MPIFEYKCQKCGHTFENIVLDKNKIIKCPKCKSTNLKKLPSVKTNFQLKGKGWFKDGY